MKTATASAAHLAAQPFVSSRLRRHRPSLLAAMLPTMTTPRWLRFGGISIGAIALLLTAFGLATLRNQQRATRLLSQEVATSVLTAQRIEESLSALDANLINLLLLPADQQAEAEQAFEEHQQKISLNLVRLAQASRTGNRPSEQQTTAQTTGAQERRAIALLQSEFATYLREAERAQVLRPTSQPQSLIVYRQASERLETRLLPAAVALQDAKYQSLEAVYQPLKGQVVEGRVVMMLLGVVLLLYLVLLQTFLSYRTHRTFNVGLIIASTTVVGLGLHVLESLTEAEQQLAQAKQQTFASLQALGQSRSRAYRAHSSLSRALLEPQNSRGAKAAQTAFRQQMAQWVQLEAQEPRLEAIAQLASPVPTGLLGLSSTPVNFREEQDAMRSVVQAFVAYRDLAEQVQVEENSAEAIALATGYRSGQLNAAFEALKSNQQRVVEIHQAAFDQSLSRSQTALEGLGWQLPLGFAFVGAFTGLGLYPRLREYSG